ncbi:MAG: dihydroorotase [Methanospirillum sp.]
MLDLVLRNVRLPEGRVVDLGIEDGRVARTVGPAAETIDCAGLMVLPGAIDMHVHLRGGAQAYKEDWESGTRSALAGGVTVVVDQPNTVPPLETVEAFEARVAEGQRRSRCGFGVNGAVTPDAELEGLYAAGALAFGEIFAAPSSYGEAIGDTVLATAFKRIAALDALATLHLEDPLPGTPATLEEHDRLRPAVGEEHALERVLALAPTGLRLHCCHLTSPGAVRCATSAGATVEVTPHHLLLDREGFEDNDGRGRVNPPLRSRAGRDALRACLPEVDAVASDHAPHTAEEKAHPFAEAPSGLPGVETMLPLLLARALDGAFPLERLIALTSTGPARILGIRPAGFAPGDRADFALFRPEAEPVRAARLHSRCGWTPYEGMPAVFPERVVLAGELAYDHGRFVDVPGAWVSGKGYKN